MPKAKPLIVSGRKHRKAVLHSIISKKFSNRKTARWEILKKPSLKRA
jgi:hypothetical protein